MAGGALVVLFAASIIYLWYWFYTLAYVKVELDDSNTTIIAEMAPSPQVEFSAQKALPTV